MAQNKPKRVRAPDYTDEEINVILSSFIKHNATSVADLRGGGGGGGGGGLGGLTKERNKK